MARRDEDPRNRQVRARLAGEAARLLAETGSDDVAWARRKAATRFAIRDEAMLPGSDEILAALRGHRQLFGGDDDARAAAERRREAALEAMRHFQEFEPRVVATSLSAAAGPDAPVRLHLHADDPDAVARALLERGVPARQTPRPMRLTRDSTATVPAWNFVAGGVAFELLQLPSSALRQPPRDPLDDRPLERATIQAVRRMLEEPPAD